MTDYLSAAGLGGLMNAGGLNAQQDQRIWYSTITASAACNTIAEAQWIKAYQLTPDPQPAKVNDPDEIAWLKRRVKEIEWRA